MNHVSSYSSVSNVLRCRLFKAAIYGDEATQLCDYGSQKSLWGSSDSRSDVVPVYVVAIEPMGGSTSSGKNFAVLSSFPSIFLFIQYFHELRSKLGNNFRTIPLCAQTCGVSGRSYTFGLAKMLSEQFAKALVAKLPLQQGDRIGFLLPNLPEYLIGIHGCLEAGFVPTFANPLYTVDEISRQFSNAGVRCIVTIPQLLEIAVSVSRPLDNYTNTINVGGTNELDRK